MLLPHRCGFLQGYTFSDGPVAGVLTLESCRRHKTQMEVRARDPSLRSKSMGARLLRTVVKNDPG